MRWSWWCSRGTCEMLLSLLYEDWRSGLIVRPSTLSSRSRHKYYPRLLLLRFMLCKVDWTVRHACMVMICIIIRCEFSRCLCVIMEWVNRSQSNLLLFVWWVVWIQDLEWFVSSEYYTFRLGKCCVGADQFILLLYSLLYNDYLFYATCAFIYYGLWTIFVLLLPLIEGIPLASVVGLEQYMHIYRHTCS